LTRPINGTARDVGEARCRSCRGECCGRGPGKKAERSAEQPPQAAPPNASRTSGQVAISRRDVLPLKAFSFISSRSMWTRGSSVLILKACRATGKRPNRTLSVTGYCRGFVTCLAVHGPIGPASACPDRREARVSPPGHEQMPSPSMSERARPTDCADVTSSKPLYRRATGDDVGTMLRSAQSAIGA
jgi:hypothetical protein